MDFFTKPKEDLFPFELCWGLEKFILSWGLFFKTKFKGMFSGDISVSFVFSQFAGGGGGVVGTGVGGWVVTGDSCWECAGSEVGTSGGRWAVVDCSGWECDGEKVGASGVGWVTVVWRVQEGRYEQVVMVKQWHVSVSGWVFVG